MEVHIAHGLSPTPRVEMKFKSQTRNPINGNDLISDVMAPNPAQR